MTVMKMSDFENERDEKLIREREEYEKEFFSHVVEAMMENEAFDKLIAERFEYIDEHFDFEPSPAYEELEEFYYSKYDPVEIEKNARQTESYMPNDDGMYDDMADYDYPEGVEENLNGQIYEPIRDVFFEDIPEPPIEMYLEEEQSFEDYYEYEPSIDDYNKSIEAQFEEYESNYKSDDYYAELYEAVMTEALVEEYDKKYENLQDLIDEHVGEEKEFMENILHEALLEDYYFEKAIDEYLLREIGMEYEPDLFDYENSDGWWVEYKEPETDPFDSFDEIDYPEGEPTYKYEVPMDYYYEEELQRDFEKYQAQKEKYFIDFIPDDDEIQLYGPFGDEIVEPDFEEEYRKNEESRIKELIEDEEKIDDLFKKQIVKEDTLNEIIKEKLKEKKFNK